MKLLDTNVLVYARQPKSPFHQWAVAQISGLVSTEGAGFSAVSLAELCAQDGVISKDVPVEVAHFGIQILDVPAGAAVKCGEAFRQYSANRKQQSGKASPKMPLPDFFIGAHAEVLGIDLITNDPGRFRTYFPKINLVTP